MMDTGNRIAVFIQDYGPPALILFSCAALWIDGYRLLVLVLLAAGCGSFFVIRTLRGEMCRTCEQKTILDQQLIQSQKLAAIGELSSGIAHEINNPLAIIGQEVEWIRHLIQEGAQQAEAPLEDLKDSLREIGQQVERCREITHKLLDFARKQEPLIQAVDINRLIEDMVRLVEREASLHNIRLERHYGEALPTVRTDAPLVRQVVLNILNNASYAIQKDGVITIETRAQGNGWVEIAVHDTGCGIPKDHLHKIFDPFFTTKPMGKGTGLGLSICHGIIERLGGRISVESEVGLGTTFRIHLPPGTTKGGS